MEKKILVDSTISIEEMNKFIDGDKKALFILRGYLPTGKIFLEFVSYKFSNCVKRMKENIYEDKRFGANNKYTITLEEGY